MAAEHLASTSRFGLLRVGLPIGFAVGLLFVLNFPDHSKSQKFVEKINGDLETLGTGAALIGRIHYSPRMAYVYYLYAHELSQERDLHLAYNISPRGAERYLRGDGTIRDSHTRRKLAPGLRLYVDSRGAKQGWGEKLALKPLPGGFREVVLRKRSSHDSPQDR